MTVLRTAAWILGIIYATIPSYWLLVHPHIAWWRRRRARLVLVGPLWFLLWVTAGAITWPWRDVVVHSTRWSWALAIPLIVAGLLVYGQARIDFSTDQVLGRSELEPHKHEQRLNTEGIRGRVRHPYYLGHLCELLGWSVGSGLLVLWYLLLFALVTGAFMLRSEEKELVARFGDEYREYQRRVPMLLPRV